MPPKSSLLKAPAPVSSNKLRAPTAAASQNKENAAKTTVKRKVAPTEPSSSAKDPLRTIKSGRITKHASASTAPEASAVKSDDKKVLKKKRPAWDTKGRLQDMEELTGDLQGRIMQSSDTMVKMTSQLVTSEQRVGELEQFRQSLESTLTVKVVENQHQQEIIDGLKQKLSEKDSEYASSLKQVSEKYEAETTVLRMKLDTTADRLQACESKLTSAREENSHLKSALGSQSANIISLEGSMRALKLKNEILEETVATQVTTIAEMTEKYESSQAEILKMEEKLRQDESIRRQLHNTIQELKGNIRVFCRVRPAVNDNEKQLIDKVQHLNFPDQSSEQKNLIVMQVYETVDGLKTMDKNNEFSFDKVFGPLTSQATIFDEISQLVQSACDGYNVCIFAYGQTGSGKTHTMEGPADAFENQEQMGMIPRGVLQIWQHTETLKSKGWQYTMEGSYLEIYNESLRDLLADPKSGDKKLDIHHGADGVTTVSNLTSKTLKSPEEVMTLLKKASANRHVAETQCNERSSRSHSVFMLRINGENGSTGERCLGMLNLIDLAGSERLNISGSVGDRKKETGFINKSLSALGDVIASLANKSPHTPYRNSKLTYLLQNSLGGNSKTLMFVNVSPNPASVDESLASLRFATKVNNCQIGTAQRAIK